KKRDELITFCSDALKTQPTMKVVFHEQLAAALVRLGRVDEALKHANAAVEAAEAQYRLTARLDRVAVLRYAERFDAAEAECVQLLKEFPQPGDERLVG